MKRWLLNIAAAVSLLLFLATVALWVRSYWSYIRVEWGDGVDTGYAWKLHAHRVAIGRGRLYYVRSYPPVISMSALGPRPYRRFALLGVVVDRGYSMLVPDGNRSAYTCVVGVPMWVPAILTTILLAPWLWTARQRWPWHGRSPGLCSKCGYDLRATPDRCPECGTVPTVTAR